MCYNINDKSGTAWDAKLKKPLSFSNHFSHFMLIREAIYMKRKTHEEYVLQLANIHPYIDIMETYTTVNKNTAHHCRRCGYDWSPRPSNLLYGKGCPVCAGRIVVMGANDLWTTRPEIAKLLKDPNDGYSVSAHSNIHLWFICPDCGKELFKDVNHVSTRGLSCDRCSDGISYPNKFIRNLLKQLNVDYTPEYNFKPSKYAYDVYISSINTIIEMHGEQHYTGWCGSQSDLDHIIENDKNKKQFALEHGIDRYIVIDSRLSEVEFLSKNILNSDLAIIFDLSVIDWNKCDRDSRKSLFMEFVNLFNQNVSRNDIMSYLQIGDTTMCRWLKQANNSGLLLINNGHFLRGAKSVVLLNTHEIFDKIADASREYNIQKTQIISVCKHKSLYAGIHPITGKPMIWRYLSEYDPDEKIDFNLIRVNSRSKIKIT
jgi:DNA-directed RNA polymerase subunit RPC12/RpoP